MTRTILVLVAVGAFLSVISGSGCASGGVGDPCIPEQEYDVCFGGFDEKEVNIESKSFQCLTRLCLVNHFQGRVSCPYGQTAGNNLITSGVCKGMMGGPPYAPTYPGTNTQTCTIPGGSSILGDSGTLATAYEIQVPVLPQETPRQTANAVYCSCRCANTAGLTNDGSVYCSCPSGYTCTQLVTSIGGASQGLTGGYCIKMGTAYDPTGGAIQEPCSPPPPGGAANSGNQCPLPE
jgi:hypothetical protein